MLVISPRFNDGGGTVNLVKLLNTLKSVYKKNQPIRFASSIEKSIYSIPDHVIAKNFNLSRASFISVLQLLNFALGMKKAERDVLICNGRGGSFYGFFLSPFFTKIYVIPRGFQEYLLSDRLISRILCIFGSKVLYATVSYSEKKAVLCATNNRMKVEVIRNPIPYFKSCVNSNDIKIVWVGRDSPEKRVNDLIHFLKNNDVTNKAEIFLSNPKEETLASLIHHNVRINKSFVDSWSSVPSILLSFSEMEGFPTVIAEGICIGMIPVLSRIPSHVEAVSFPLIFGIGDVLRARCITRRVALLIDSGRIHSVRRYIKINPDEFSYSKYNMAWNKLINYT